MTGARDKVRRRNHFVAAAYLAPFSDSGERNGVFFEYRRSRLDRVLSTTPNAVATEKDLYVRPGPIGEREDSVERYFADSIEAPFGQVRQKLFEALGHGITNPVAVLSPAEFEVLTNFLLTQQMRTPVERQAMEWIGQIGARELVRTELTPGSRGYDVWKQLFGGTIPEEKRPELERSLQAIAHSTLKARKSWITIAIRNALRMAAIVRRDFHVRLVTVPSGIELVSCDMPLVSATQGEGVIPDRFGNAWLHPGFEAMIALSPRHFVHMSQTPSDDSRLFSEGLASWLREATVGNANEAVYALHEADDIPEILRNTPRSVYYIEIEDRQYPAGHDVDEIDAHLRASGVDNYAFRYGPLRGN